MSHISCQGGSAEFFAPPCFPKQFGGGFLQLFEKTADVAAVVDGVGKLSAYRQHRPVPCRVDLPQQDEWREVRLEVPAEAEGGEGQPRHGGDTADIWGQGLVAEQAAAGLRPGVVRLKVLAEHIIVRHKAGDLHGE